MSDPDGLDVARLSRLRTEAGDECVRGCGRVHPADVALGVPDVVVPAARENVVDDDAALATEARLVVEGASLPTTSRAGETLAKRDIRVVPDFITNAGGNVAAAHSMDPRYSPFMVDPGDILTMISTKSRANAAAVADRGTPRTDETPHAAAARLAQQRVLAAMRLRRQLPLTIRDPRS